jgi:ubiquinone/menaquinone biosynthesis C-methylase UbiE
MDIVNKLWRSINSGIFTRKETAPEKAYTLWSENYDNQPGNLVLDLDDSLFSELLKKISLQDKFVADVGCGTGRHWEKIYSCHPYRLVGYDVSEGMLKVLKNKFPEAETYQIRGTRLSALENNSCDVIISTLVLAHIVNIEKAFTEWNRVLNAKGNIILTDYHPDMLLLGGKRTFNYHGKPMAVKSYIHPLSKINTVLQSLKLEMKEYREKRIDDTMEHYYQKQDVLHVYKRFKGTPVVYGVHITKQHASK